MKRRIHWPMWLGMLAMFVAAVELNAADLESFEFGDGSGTSLALAANTANPGNQWLEDANMFPSDVRSGAYNLVHTSTIVESNFLQMANVTSGTVYLVARMSGWKFGSTLDAANLEEVRFGFLNDDDADFGSTITAQMTLRRNAAGDVELVGDALGAGSSNISGAATFAATRSTPLTVALELNKTSNSYKVFYKDNTGATQVLGLGGVAPTRDGNSLRFATNNDFAEGNFDYPVVPADEVFSVDRIALANTNPFTDLITLDVDRDNGAMTLRNTSGATLTGIQSYSINSALGGLNPAGWMPVAGGTTSSSSTELMQTLGSAINLTNGQTLSLSNASGAWLKSPFEDVSMVLNLSGGVTRTVNVNFIDNGGLKYATGDFNADNSITAADYTILATNAETSLAGLSRVEGYRKGDLGGDGINSIEDFIQFKTLYEAANGGAGSFERMLAGVPEPTSGVLVALASFAVAGVRRRRTCTALSRGNCRTASTRVSSVPRGDFTMRRIGSLVGLLGLLLAVAASSSQAAILEDFLFNDANGTTLDMATNSVNASNNWLAHANTVESSTLNGSFRINKQSQTAQASNVLDIANVTTGKVWLVTELAGWNYTATASSPSERVRFAFLDSTDPPTTGSSAITAEANIDRSGGGLALRGEALGTGSTAALVNSYALPLVRTTPFIFALELDKTADQYSIYYKDNTDPYQLLGTGNLGASTLNAGDRDGNSLRFAFTGTFGDTGEYFDVNRIYLTDTSPITTPVDPITLTLEVRSNGLMFIKNETANAVSFDSYRIASGTSSLNEAGWASLESGGFDSIGAGAGQHWTAAGGASDAVLAESFLLGASTLDPNEQFPLGSAFKVGGTQDLTFQYRDTVSGSLVSVVPTYVTVAGVAGDYSNNGVVDAEDYTIWRDHLNSSFQLDNEGGISPGTVDAADYNFWKSRFGATSGAGIASVSAVPEPASMVLLTGMAVWGLAVGGRRRCAWLDVNPGRLAA